MEGGLREGLEIFNVAVVDVDSARCSLHVESWHVALLVFLVSFFPSPPHPFSPESSDRDWSKVLQLLKGVREGKRLRY